MEIIKSLTWGKWILIVLAISFFIFVYNMTSKYWVSRLYAYWIKGLDKQQLKFRIDIVLAKYKRLDEEDSILKRIEEIRNLEVTLKLTPFDFSSAKKEYDETLEKVKKRGYI